MIKVFQSGNSVKFIGTFKDWNGSFIDPTSAKFIVYDGRYTKLAEVDASLNKVELGKYFIEYSFDNEGEYVIEWNGQIGGTTSLNRERIRVQFV